MRHLRGAWARRRVLLPLVVLSATVVAGAVATLGLAREEGTSRLLVVPLLVIGAVAVPASARELALARRGEIALARLRGVEAGELQALLLVEPLLALLAGGGLGVALGALAGPLGTDAALAAAGVVAVALLAVLAGAAATLREPLAAQVSPAARPRRTSVAGVFGSVLVLVAALVAVYRARQGGDEPDLVVLAGPALVGLAAGQLVVWLVRLLARLAVRRGGGGVGGGGLPGFLAARRLARLPEAAGAVRVLVGAAVVAALAVSGAVQVGDWADDEARLRVGAPLQVPLEGADALDVLALTRSLDPEGRWLMAAVLVPGPGGVAARRVFLDTARYDAVVGDLLAGTPAAAVADHLDDLAGAAPSAATGDRIAVTVAGVSARRAGVLRPVVEVGYRDDSGAGARVRLEAAVGPDGAPTRVEADLPGCARGCQVTSLSLGRPTGTSPLPWVLTGLEIGGADAFAGVPRSVDNGVLAPAGETAEVEVGAAGAATPVLATASVPAPERGSVQSPGGDERPTEVLDVLPALPLVEADGLLVDLPTAAAGAPPTVPAAQVLVLARADTPDGVLAGLAAAGGGAPVTLAAARDAVEEESGAAQARVYALMAGFCLVVALLVLLTSVTRQRDDWRRDAAALRVTGLDPRTVRRSGRLEVAVLGTATAAAVLAGAVVAVRLLLGELALVDVPVHAVALRTGLAAVPLMLVGLAAVVAVLLVAGRGRAVGATSRPAILREEAQR